MEDRRSLLNSGVSPPNRKESIETGLAGKQAGGDQMASEAVAPEVDMAPVFTGVKAKVEGDAETTPDAATAPDLAIGVKDKSGASSVVVFVVCLSGVVVVVVIVVVTALSGVEVPG